MKVVIVGGSAAGNFAALLLARDGCEVELIEQDVLDPAPDVEAAASTAFRAAAPQIVQPHIVMAKCRELLIDRLPDVYRALLAAGVVDAQLSTQMPASLTDTSARAGDERLATLMTRRSTVDWVLQRTVRAEPGVTVNHGTRVQGLLAVPGNTPRVVGVRTDVEELGADVVIDATGRRSPVDRWLSEIGAQPTAMSRSECGIAYYTRHYRWRSEEDLPGAPTTRIVAGLDEFTVGIWGADNGVMQLVVAPLTKDARFKAVRRPETFDAVLRTAPVFAPWVEAMDPVTDVFPMAGLHNTLRRLIRDGGPVVTGLHAIGDSVCTTNPTLGRGMALAIQGAADLLRVLNDHAEDFVAQALALDELVGQHVAPFYEDQAAIDFGRLAFLRHKIFGDPVPELPAPRSDRVTFGEIRTAAPLDPTVFRALWKIMGMICPPDEVYTDPDVVARTRDVLRDQGSVPAMPQPTREELLAALRSSA